MGYESKPRWPKEMAYPGQEFSRDGLRLTLAVDGTVMVKAKHIGHHDLGQLKHADTGNPWIPQWKNFRSIAAQMVREGDADHLIKMNNKAIEKNKMARHAANDLLEALKQAVQALLDSGYDHSHPVVREANQAITKATTKPKRQR